MDERIQCWMELAKIILEEILMSYKRRLDFDVADLRLVLYVEALALNLCVTAMGLSKNSAGKNRHLSKGLLY